jgi:hypothetical protein
MTTEEKQSTSENTPLPKEVEILQKLWESYISMSTFFCNLIGATFATFVALPMLKDNPGILHRKAAIFGMSLIAASLLVAIFWRWASQWAMELEVIGGNSSIDDFFKRANRSRVITGAAQTGLQKQIEERSVSILRRFMKVAAGIILILYLSGVFAVVQAF